jgi:HK97 family phage major capsid protein
MHPDALAAVRKAQRAAGLPISETALLGYPILETEAMDAPGGSPAGFCIAFGNWRRGLVIADRTDLRISADEVTVPGFQRFNIRRRVGGRVHDNRALKLLRL